MPFPSAGGHSLLAKCSSTLLCYLRFAPLWLLAIVVLLLGAARHRIVAAVRRPPPTSDKARTH